MRLFQGIRTGRLHRSSCVGVVNLNWSSKIGLVRHLFGKSLAPASTPEPTSEPTPPSTPAAAPVPEPPPIYVIHDPAGIAVDISLESDGPEHPAKHAAELLRALMHDDAISGGLALEKVIKKYYRTICPSPFPWLTVLRHFNRILRDAYGDTAFKTYKWVHRGRRRRRLRVYHIPRAQSAAQSPEQAA